MQKLLARLLTSCVAFTAFYYSFWVIVMPFVDEEHILQKYFLPRRYAVIVPSIFVIFAIGVLGIWVAFVLFRDRLQQSTIHERRLSLDKFKEQ